MNRTAIIFIALILFPQPSIAYIAFERTYGGATQDWGYSVQQTLDGGYIIAGTTNSFGAGYWDFYLVKTDSLGDTLWTKTYGGIYSDYGLSVQQTSDGGYIITGWTESFGAGSWNVYLIKTDSLGNTLWSRAYGSALEDVGNSVQQTLDGGYIISGWTFSFGSGRSDVYLIRTNSSGDVLWTKTYGGISYEDSYSVQQTQDGGFVIVGSSLSFGAGSDDVYLIRTDSLGDTLWTKTYGGIYSDYGRSVQQTSDGGYIIAGYSTSFGLGFVNFYVIKSDSVGDTLWTKTYGGVSDYALSIQQTSDGGYIVAGLTHSFGALGRGDGYLVKTDAFGETLWTKWFGGGSPDVFYSVQQTLDGGYIIAGGTQSFGAGQDDIYLIKIGPHGIHCRSFNDLVQTIAEAEIDNEGIRNSLQSKANNAREKFDEGNLRTSGNILCALLHEIDAQDGKHIDPISTQELRDCVTTLATNLEIRLRCLTRDKVDDDKDREYEDKDDKEEKCIDEYPMISLWNSPNPFTTNTKIFYRILDNKSISPILANKKPRHFELKIYDIRGLVVRNLVKGEKESGLFTFVWDGKDDEGKKVSSGIYFYRLTTEGITQSQKLILIR